MPSSIRLLVDSAARSVIFEAVSISEMLALFTTFTSQLLLFQEQLTVGITASEILKRTECILGSLNLRTKGDDLHRRIDQVNTLKPLKASRSSNTHPIWISEEAAVARKARAIAIEFRTKPLRRMNVCCGLRRKSADTRSPPTAGIYCMYRLVHIHHVSVLPCVHGVPPMPDYHREQDNTDWFSLLSSRETFTGDVYVMSIS